MPSGHINPATPRTPSTAHPINPVTPPLYGAHHQPQRVRPPHDESENHMSNDRDKALDMALAQIDKQFGKGAIMKMG
ncbi:MAG: hypothetical protein WBL31_14150, partial [Ilumatobacteraceae bacterium]